MSRRFALVALVVAACGARTQAPLTPPPPLPPAPVAKAEPTPLPPPPADPAPVADGDVTEAWVNGVHVIIKRVPTAELVAGHVYILGGARNWDKEDAGVEQLALAVASQGGTQKFDKQAFGRRLAALGSNIFSWAGLDYAAIGCKSLKAGWDETFSLLVDSFLTPAMPAAEIELQRQRQLSDLRHEEEDPDTRLAVLVHQGFFAGHRYENRPIGTVGSVSRLGAEQLGKHLAGLRQSSRLLVVVVGDVQPEHIIGQVKAAFAGLPRGDYTHAPLPPVSFAKTHLVTVEKKLPTNYIQATFVGPAWTDPDYYTATVAMHLLQHRLFEEVRTKRNLSYAPGARFVGFSAVTQGALYVTAVDPNTTIKVIYDEARRLQTEPVPEKDLAGDKAVFLSNFLMRNETTDGQADILAMNQVYRGDWRAVRALPDKIRAVTPADVQAFAKKYIGHLQVVVLGDPAKIDQTLFTSL